MISDFTEFFEEDVQFDGVKEDVFFQNEKDDVKNKTFNAVFTIDSEWGKDNKGSYFSKQTREIKEILLMEKK
jgi:hypothetical protein